MSPQRDLPASHLSFSRWSDNRNKRVGDIVLHRGWLSIATVIRKVMSDARFFTQAISESALASKW
jgi:hypothetical protein